MRRIFRRTAALAEYGTNVEQANATYLEQVLQQLWAAPLDGGLVDPVQIDRVVCHQPVAARYQLQAEFAFAQARTPR